LRDLDAERDMLPAASLRDSVSDKAELDMLPAASALHSTSSSSDELPWWIRLEGEEGDDKWDLRIFTKSSPLVRSV
jgi:hypothetical protein